MSRLNHLAVVIPILASIAQAEDARSARQQYVLRVPPKVRFERSGVPAGSTSTTRARPSEAAIHLGGTASAGITARFEVRPLAGEAGNSQHQLNLRLSAGEHPLWELQGNAESRSGEATGSRVQATSRGPGAATLIISSRAESQELEIITTIISND